MPKVLLPEFIDPCGPDYLKSHGWEIVHAKSREKEDILEKISDCDAIIVRVSKITKEIMQAAPSLKVIAKHGVGYDNIDIEAARALGIPVTIVPNGNSLSVAEHTVALMMACAKNMPAMANGYRESGYDVKNRLECTELSGKTLGLIGYGRIGSMVAKICRSGFDMHVIAYDPFIKGTPEGVEIVDNCDDIFRRSDYISLHSPLTDETRHSIGQREFKLMKNSATIINCSRGAIIDEQALIEALLNGEIGGAGLDVSDPEPAQSSNPMFNMENVILTPHNAASTTEALKRMSMGAALAVDAVYSGKLVDCRII